MKKSVFLLLLFTFPLLTFGQNDFTKEIKLVTDNDLYVSYYNDRYYTSGIFLSYRKVPKNEKKKGSRNVQNFQLGHKLFTPSIALVKTIDEHDRPFAGQFYGSFGIDFYLNNDAIFKPEIQVGVIGKGAFGQEIQDLIHVLYGYEKSTGWQYQVSDALALNLNASYIKILRMNSSKRFDLSWFNRAQLGTVQASVTTGFYSRVGFKPLVKLVNSIAFGGHLAADNSSKEFFLYFKPTVRYALYDATIQGSFLNDKSPVTFDVKSLQFDGEVGLAYKSQRFVFGYGVHFYSKRLESENVPDVISYGTIAISYLIR